MTAYRGSGPGADRTGTDAHNLQLSGARAAAVRERLVAHGVAGARIAIQPLGETAGLVATPDGVEEAQNRRAEIFLLMPA